MYGDGKVLLDQLREVAELLADGFNASGRTSKDLLNGLVQKVRVDVSPKSFHLCVPTFPVVSFAVQS